MFWYETLGSERLGPSNSRSDDQAFSLMKSDEYTGPMDFEIESI